MKVVVGEIKDRCEEVEANMKELRFQDDELVEGTSLPHLRCNEKVSGAIISIQAEFQKEFRNQFYLEHIKDKA
ncbi:Uncharacterized protein TCM_006322 [Theobroma cacao]|uniref:Uncharacterized protein n=1 Tax=Theobroma cacao TaxID=3641 RepID=A0A061DXX9_THECC|nr:Uncharacterized protein TCM_006322 [Theobroma cacao]